MSGPGSPGEPGGADAGDGDRPPGPRLGTGTFTIEGRAAPGLFVLGWLASLLGLGVTFVGWQAAASGPGLVVLVAGLVLLTVGLVAGGGSQAIERRRRGEPYQGPSPVLVFAAAVALATLLTIAIGAPLSALGIEASRPVGELILVSLQFVAYVGLVALLVVGSGALSWRDMGFRARDVAAELGWGAVLAAPVILVSILISAILVAVLRVTPEGPLPPTGAASGLILHLVAGALIAPVGEELLFRGVATTAWVRSLGVRAGILRAALFFALAHVLTIGGASFGEAAALAFVGFATRLPVALVLGWVYVRRASIWAPIGLHAAFNAALLILSEAAIRAAG